VGRGGVGVRGARSRASYLLTVAADEHRQRPDAEDATSGRPLSRPRSTRGASPAAGGGDRGADGEEGERDGPATRYQRSPTRQRPIRPQQLAQACSATDEGSDSRRGQHRPQQPRELGGMPWPSRMVWWVSASGIRPRSSAAQRPRLGTGKQAAVPVEDVEGGDRQTQQRSRTPPGFLERGILAGPLTPFDQQRRHAVGGGRRAPPR
jgi:hypothetical protein